MAARALQAIHMRNNGTNTGAGASVMNAAVTIDKLAQVPSICPISKARAE
ncbi:hypothetical protein [Alicyclobacillus acidoterrestris]|uniref:Uncharacterized protein n=1 Tax=Alicyclobacillus acidoterrestris (strain ATCC 49025 / DSM 3922 / CIP 106132 / NCIMB 13137 / GD3B) TaxID=1356854 RepID=A0A9E6ZH41_ALIAG|nr:hypothetical protein [Alicyclobacillus acidoterrestris]UNO50490.1 hypothetical protein K1I37_08545 [Alicyclobacillus acidoterrestris]